MKKAGLGLVHLLILSSTVTAFGLFGPRTGGVGIRPTPAALRRSVTPLVSKAKFPSRGGGGGDTSSSNSNTQLSSSSAGSAESQGQGNSSGRNWKKWFLQTILPTIAALAIGGRVGAIKAGANINFLPKLPNVSVTVGKSRLLVGLILLFCIREFQFALPSWLTSSGGSDSGLTSPTVIISRLRSLFKEMGTKLDSDLGAADTRFAFYTTVLLQQQVKRQDPKARDDRYESSGTVEKNPKKALKGMDQMFEFADWAYDEFENENAASVKLKEALESVNYQLIRHDKLMLPGRVPHYVAINADTKTAIIGVKGTSEVEDLLTDCCGTSVEYTLGDGRTIYCHEGVLTSAKSLADELEPLVMNLLLPDDYHIVLTGHSLGAGAAALAGLILRSRNSALDGKMKVYAFASPPVMDYETAKSCKSYMTTFVNNSDIIPRSSVANLAVLVEFLTKIRATLNEAGKNPTSLFSGGVFGYIRMMYRGPKGKMIISAEDMNQMFDDASEKVGVKDPEHLCIPGKVIHMFDLWAKAQDKKEKRKDDDKEDPPTSEVVITTDGSSKVLRVIETDPRMVGDHNSQSYRDSIRGLLAA